MSTLKKRLERALAEQQEQEKAARMKRLLNDDYSTTSSDRDKLDRMMSNSMMQKGYSRPLRTNVYGYKQGGKQSRSKKSKKSKRKSSKKSKRKRSKKSKKSKKKSSRKH